MWTTASAVSFPLRVRRSASRAVACCAVSTRLDTWNSVFGHVEPIGRVSRSEFSFSARSYCSDCAAVRRDGAAEDLYCPGLLLLCLAQRVLALPQLGVGQKPVCTRDMTCAAQCLQALSVFMLMLGQLLSGAPELRQRAERSPSHCLHSTAPRTCSASHVKPEYRQLGRMLSTVRDVAVVTARRGQSGSAGNQGSALVPQLGRHPPQRSRAPARAHTQSTTRAEPPPACHNQSMS